ncbi:MAG: hypothetical protein N5P05_000158 [Chroococcopsis gigantea SAG 12.99]|jgi:ribosomal protein S18 acetylase RimI-like enzyme|nr:GNAT family N-acetyltransferase [Chlorogloea purpurea SAG 13.99]MDV2998552.1 hypothetical protein [Chroococcopsis gigantea SAG 12.99]
MTNPAEPQPQGLNLSENNVNPLFNVHSCILSYLGSEPSRANIHPLESSPLSIRVAQLADLKTVVEILTESFYPQDYFWLWLRPVFKLGMYEDLKTRLRTETPHYYCLVATQDTTIIGTVEIGLKSTSLFSNAIPYVSNLAVSRSQRRKGVALKLLAKCEQVAMEWGFNELSLHVLENNSAAYSLYRNNGYDLQRIEGRLSKLLFQKPNRLLLGKTLK